jgi:hypothetical protein
VFTGLGQAGDFRHEIKNCSHLSDRTLYIFNDNAQDHRTSIAGGGNAIIRPFNKYNAQQPTKSAGISTGLSPAAGGFNALTPSVQQRIDAEIDEIRVLLASGEYDRVKYSADRSNPVAFGTGIFVVHADVKRYIGNALKAFHMRTPFSLSNAAAGASSLTSGSSSSSYGNASARKISIPPTFNNGDGIMRKRRKQSNNEGQTISDRQRSLDEDGMLECEYGKRLKYDNGCGGQASSSEFDKFGSYSSFPGSFKSSCRACVKLHSQRRTPAAPSKNESKRRKKSNNAGKKIG